MVGIRYSQLGSLQPSHGLGRGSVGSGPDVEGDGSFDPQAIFTGSESLLWCWTWWTDTWWTEFHALQPTALIILHLWIGRWTLKKRQFKPAFWRLGRTSLWTSCYCFSQLSQLKVELQSSSERGWYEWYWWRSFQCLWLASLFVGMLGTHIWLAWL